MNLFNVDDKYLSHPNYSYNKHIQNIADSFDDSNHKVSAMFHDLGKLAEAFQTYIDESNPNNFKTTHSLESAFIYLSECYNKLDINTFPIFMSILKHHGNLENVNELSKRLDFSEFVLSNFPNINRTITEILEIIKLDNNFDLDECCDFFDTDNFVNKYYLSGLNTYFKIKEIFSRLIFADKYEAIFKESYHETTFTNTGFYITKLLNLISNKHNNLSSIRNQARNDIIKKYKKNSDKRIFLIEAPTGIGKTFIALHLALEITKDKNKKRIINALPMTSIIDQTFKEYSEIFESDILMKYHHLSFSKEYFNPDKEKRNEEDFYKQKDSFISKSWSEDNVIITTFNQLLNLFYSNKNRDLIKFWTLRDSVIILDEIQAIPRVLLKDFSQTINFLTKYLNIDFILMSATIPDIKGFIDKSLLCELLDNKYYKLDFNNRYELRIDNSINNESKLVNEILVKHKKGNSILAVLNTKKLALKIFTELLELGLDDNLFLLSSLFIPKHRKKKLSDLKCALLKKKKIILISTQVVEAGVDLDFDIGFREFSPLYSIIQTAGRVNRENRIEVKDTAELIIIPELGYSPYHQNDILKEILSDLLKEKIRENDLLPLLKKYFEIAIKRTPPETLLIGKMENLEYENVIKIFNNHFMKSSPFLTTVFIEYEENLYNLFQEKLINLYNKLQNKDLKLEEKMELKVSIKEIYKQISFYVINVPKLQADILPPFYKESEMKVCEYGMIKDFYSYKTGWKLKHNNLLMW